MSSGKYARRRVKVKRKHVNILSPPDSSSSTSDTDAELKIARWVSRFRSCTSTETSNEESKKIRFTNYPNRAQTVRTLSASGTKNRQIMRALHVTEIPFSWPDFRDYGALSQLEVHSLCPVMQWLLDGVSVTTPTGDTLVVNTVAVPEAEKKLIWNELKESSMLKVASAVKKGLQGRSSSDITSDLITEIILGCTNINVPRKILEMIAIIFQRWFPIITGYHVKEINLDKMVLLVADLIMEEEDLTKISQVQIWSGKQTEREFYMCGQKNTVQSNVEIHINTSGDIVHPDFRLLTVIENKSNQYRLDCALPQMMCHQVAAAKESCFSTPDHYIVYNVSMCGQHDVFLSRAHIHKELVKRQDLSVHDEPPIQQSYLFDLSEEYCRRRHLINLYPLLKVYMATKALLLLHKKVN